MRGGVTGGTDVLDRPEQSVPAFGTRIADRLGTTPREADGNTPSDRIPFELRRDLQTTAHAAEESPG